MASMGKLAVKARPFEFKIDAYTPQTLPMLRLAEYLDGLAILFGNPEHVHFLRVKKGSAVLEATVDEPATQRVLTRIQSIRDPEAPDDVRTAFKKVNKLLRDDNASAVLKGPSGAKVLTFPGRKTPVPEEVRVHQAGALQGQLIRIGGIDETVPVWIQDVDGRIYTHCYTTNRETAKLLAPYYLRGTLRLFGRGVWLRDHEGKWNLERFSVQSFEPLHDASPKEVVEGLRKIGAGEWDELEDPVEQWKRQREDD
jgi:hypothetical protein